MLTLLLLQELQTLLSLRGSEHENLDSKLDKILQEITKLSPDKQENNIDERLKQLETAVKAIAETQTNLKEKTRTVEAKFAGIEKLLNTKTSDGVVYTRWGRTTCPSNGTAMVYTGYAAGDHYTHSGGSPDMLCLPEEPIWAKHDASLNYVGGYLYGVEYEMDNGRDKSILGKGIFQQDVPCAVCETQQRSRRVMIPGRTECYDGWTAEYWGYLMSGHYKHAKNSNHYCVDADPDVLPGGHTNHNGYLLYFVEVRCHALKCPPYKKGWEVPCVVCTK